MTQWTIEISISLRQHMKAVIGKAGDLGRDGDTHSTPDLPLLAESLSFLFCQPEITPISQGLLWLKRDGV